MAPCRCQTVIVPVSRMESSAQFEICLAVAVVIYGSVRSVLFTSDLFT